MICNLLAQNLTASMIEDLEAFCIIYLLTI